MKLWYYSNSICLCFLLVFGPTLLSAIHLTHFYPYGTSTGDTTLPRSDDGASPAISLFDTPFNFFNRRQTSLYVNNNGIISFGARVSAHTHTPFPLNGSVLIAPYWADVDTFPSMGGFVHYRHAADPISLNLARDQIRAIFPVDFQNFTPTFLFIATWDHVGYYRSNTDKTNTFQCVLTSDTTHSFVLFLYADDLIQWTTGDITGSNGLGGIPAQCGLNAGDGNRFFSIPGSQTAAIINIYSTSNIDVPGIWVFRVDQNTIIHPQYSLNECSEGTDNCHTNAYCVNTIENFECSCSPGYSGDGIECNDIDECSEGIPSCDPNALCANTVGSYICICQFGYTGDGSTCIAIPDSPVSLQNVSITTTTATVTWSAPPFDPTNRIASYKLTLSDDTFGLPDIEVMLSEQPFQYTFTGLEEHVNYTCDVISVGEFNTFSSPISINFTTLEAVPSSAPQSPQGVAVGPMLLIIIWLPPPAIDINGVIKHYLIEVTENITGQVIISNATEEHILVRVRPGIEYCCRVAAFTIGLGPFTHYFNITSQESEPSGPPLNIEANTTDSYSLSLRWEPPLPSDRNGRIVSYLINVTAVETGETFEINTTYTTLSLTLPLSPFTTYEFMIAASTGVGPGPFSQAISVLTPEDVPSEPLSFNVSTISGSPRSLSVSWLPPRIQNGIIIGYTVYCMEEREQDRTTTSSIGTESGDSASDLDMIASDNSILTIVAHSNETEITFPGLIPYTLYSCYASANTSAGEGNFTVQVVARTDDKSVCRKLVLEGGWFSYSNNQSLNSMATYHCNDGLELINNSQRTCMIDGQWNGSESSCARELQGKLEYSDGLNIGSVASYQCAHASGHQQIRCETTGWSGALCDCLSPPEGGVLTYSSDLINKLNIATYQCNDGLQLTQLRLIRTCTFAGWDKEALPCVCEELSLPGSGTIEYSSNQSIGSTASYLNFQCTMGFEQSGKLVRRCSENGWDGEIPHCRLTMITATAISVVATLVLIIAVSTVVFMLRKYYIKRKLLRDHYDVPNHYALPPLPPRIQRMDSGIYDTISNKSTEIQCETAFSTAVIDDIPCNGISFIHRQSNIENGDAPSIDTTGAEVFQNIIASESDHDSMVNPPETEGPENKIRENRVTAANINFESTTVVNEKIFGERLELQENQEKEKNVDESIIQDYSLEKESTTREETVHVQMQENASYQPTANTNFVLFANPAYGTDIAIAPEIPTEDNIAYQRTRMCSTSSQLSSHTNNTSSSSELATQRNDSLVSDED